MFTDLKFTYPVFLLLPVEMWAVILGYLDDETLLSAALTSKRFMKVCKGDPILRKRIIAQIVLERRFLRGATLDRDMCITVLRNYVPSVINVNQKKTVLIKKLTIKIPRVDENHPTSYFKAGHNNSSKIGCEKRHMKSSKKRVESYKTIRLITL
ncbi:hypothetical protein FQA39_LY13489 [Lamprigera yunnana]|nr:hypothetical protein FQA39_LY13489 [Lamprigera yunnana]